MGARERRWYQLTLGSDGARPGPSRARSFSDGAWNLKSVPWEKRQNFSRNGKGGRRWNLSWLPCRVWLFSNFLCGYGVRSSANSGGLRPEVSLTAAPVDFDRPAVPQRLTSPCGMLGTGSSTFPSRQYRPAVVLMKLSRQSQRSAFRQMRQAYITVGMCAYMRYLNLY